MTAMFGSSPVSIAGWSQELGWEAKKAIAWGYWVHLAFLFSFLVGFHTRISSVIVWLGHTIFMNASIFAIYGVDRYFHLFIFLSIFMPMGARYSVDAYFLRKPLGNSRDSLLILQLATTITYLHAGISKMRGTDWWDGNAIWRAVNLPEFRQFDMLWLSDFPLIMKILCWGTLLLETGYIIAVWVRPLRVPWALGIITLHAGIALFMGLRLFGISLIAINFVLFVLPTFRQEEGIEVKRWTDFLARRPKTQSTV